MLNKILVVTLKWVRRGTKEMFASLTKLITVLELYSRKMRAAPKSMGNNLGPYCNLYSIFKQDLVPQK